ncbi:MAG: LL-diaminopimelate aminotransferase [Deltaproteobacteria bacterium]|nr:LL-diaminopimelate aminotransferase [Deltaproteobacteria bacterium]
MKIETADRLTHIPPYLFAEIDRKKREVAARGIEILDFGVGDPDLPTPAFIVEALKEGFSLSNYHQYPSYSGSGDFKKAVSSWIQKRFDVSVDAETEVLALIGSKEGIGHFPLAIINPGEKVLYTSPGYPVYKVATAFAGGLPEEVPLKLEHDFLPQIEKLSTDAKLFFFNYPNNPTSASCTLSFFKEIVAWAKKTNTILCHDAAYSELYFEKPSPSILEVPGAKDIAIEFHSLSKTFNMTGWRIGFAIGNAKLISALGKIKTNVDSGQFLPIQHAAICALKEGWQFSKQQRTLFQERKDLLVSGLEQKNLTVFPCKATFYVWVQCPKTFSSISFSNHLLENLGIVTTPGVGFGEAGEGYIRFSCTNSTENIQKALQRLKDLKV